ncbi:MAG: MoaD/ThiS family protein [Planctomycetota bacterium]
MPKVFFTPNLQRHMDAPRGQYAGTTVKEALDDVFKVQTALRGYVVDEQGRLRQHVIVFVDGKPLQDRVRLSDSLGDHSEVWVMQALSGG